MLGEKRAVVIALATQIASSPQGGVVSKVVELTRIFSLNTTLKELLEWSDTKQTQKINLIFESEAPEIIEED